MSSTAEIINFPCSPERKLAAVQDIEAQAHEVDLVIRDFEPVYLPKDAFEETAIAGQYDDHSVTAHHTLGSDSDSAYYRLRIQSSSNIEGAIQDSEEAFIKAASYFKDVGLLDVVSCSIDGVKDNYAQLKARKIVFWAIRNEVLWQIYLDNDGLIPAGEPAPMYPEPPVRLHLLKAVEPAPLVA